MKQAVALCIAAGTITAMAATKSQKVEHLQGPVAVIDTAAPAADTAAVPSEEVTVVPDSEFVDEQIADADSSADSTYGYGYGYGESESDTAAAATDSAAASKFKSDGYFLVGGSLYDLKDFMDRMHAEGFPTSDNASYRIGFGRNYRKKVFTADYTFEGQWFRKAESDLKNTGIAGFDFGFAMGADVIRASNVALFPYAAIDIGATFLHMSYNIPFSEIAGDNAPEDVRLSKFSSGVSAGLGFDFHRKSTEKKPQLGFRVGYRYDLTDGKKWNRDESSVTNGPDLNMTGFFGSVIFGIAKPKADDSAE